jgi:hypothetical protein
MGGRVTVTVTHRREGGLCRVNKSHSRSASLDIDNRKALALVDATTAPTTTIPGDRAAISELPLAEAFR